MSVPGESSITDLTTQRSGDLVFSGVAPPEIGYPVMAGTGRQARLGTLLFDHSFAAERGLAKLERDGPFTSIDAQAVESHGDHLLLAGSAGEELFVTRFDRDGILDTDFGDNGMALAAPPPGAPSGEVSSGGLALQPDGKIVVAGSTFRNLRVARFNPDGSLDDTFGSAGQIELGHGGGSVALAPAPEGKLLVSAASGSIKRPFSLARLDPNGRLDPTFGNGGIATAAPCRTGNLVKRRRSGCTSSARARIRSRGLTGRRPSLSLSVRNTRPLDPIETVWLTLPPSLKVDTRHRGRIRAQAPGSRRPPRVKLRAHTIRLDRLGDTWAVRVALRPGALVQAGPRGRHGALLFRVTVAFADTSSQTIRIRR